MHDKTDDLLCGRLIPRKHIKRKNHDKKYRRDSQYAREPLQYLQMHLFLFCNIILFDLEYDWIVSLLIEAPRSKLWGTDPPLAVSLTKSMRSQDSPPYKRILRSLFTLSNLLMFRCRTPTLFHSHRRGEYLHLLDPGPWVSTPYHL